MEFSCNLILALANIAILRADNSSQYQLGSQTGTRSARHSLRPQNLGYGIWYNKFYDHWNSQLLYDCTTHTYDVKRNEIRCNVICYAAMENLYTSLFFLSILWFYLVKEYHKMRNFGTFKHNQPKIAYWYWYFWGIQFKISSWECCLCWMRYCTREVTCIEYLTNNIVYGGKEEIQSDSSHGRGWKLYGSVYIHQIILQ